MKILKARVRSGIAVFSFVALAGLVLLAASPVRAQSGANGQGYQTGITYSVEASGNQWECSAVGSNVSINNNTWGYAVALDGGEPTPVTFHHTGTAPFLDDFNFFPLYFGSNLHGTHTIRFYGWTHLFTNSPALSDMWDSGTISFPFP